ncbi:MAG TPA: rod shape-determining protein MreD [Dysgonamonadaceae bacterium]|nr:rod shape-determining protein MreD [Dysgonamonadaceae bacterium]
MKLDYLYEIVLFVVLIVLQVLVFNQISVFGFATPFLYIYFLLKLPIGRNEFYVIIIGFVMGMIIDVFLNTPGINAAAATLVAVLRRPLLQLFFTKEETEEYMPNIYTAPASFTKYATVAVILHQTALYTLESLSLFNLQIVLMRWASSIVLTLILLFALDAFMYKTFAADE